MPEPLTLEQLNKRSRDRLYPSLSDPNWLILRRRRLIFESKLATLPETELDILDVGGRLQPYRQLLGKRIKRYIAVDPLMTSLVHISAVAEFLPFRDEQFDFVICTQVCEYFSDPSATVREMRRVLRRGGILFLSAPSFAIRDHEDEYWRFLPAGLRHLLQDFSSVAVIPEGNSLTGMIRTLNVFVHSFFRPRVLLPLCDWSVIPFLNIMGLLFEKVGRKNDQLTANFSVWARK